MKKRIGTVILTGALAAAMVLPMTATAVFAGRGGGKGQNLQTQTGTMHQVGVQHRMRDGSCLDPVKEGGGAMKMRGNTYGPGDGTGNMGDRPMDGTGYGAPSQR